MNKGQEMFYNFFIERTADGKTEEAKTLLEDCFKKQDTGDFSREYFEEITPKMFSLIKPEAVDELKTAMNSFSSRL